jgi:hypothetical protein
MSTPTLKSSQKTMIVDDLDNPLDILELHLLLIALVGNLLLAFPQVGRHAVIALLLLLLLLTELLCELHDLSTLLSTMAPGVVHRALQTALITAGALSWLLVASQAMAPTICYYSSSSNGSTSHWLIVVVVVATDLLLLPVPISATALSSSFCFWLASLPCLWRRQGMTCTPFYSPGALVHQAKELRDILHIVCA